MLPASIKSIISLRNLKKLVQYKSNDKFKIYLGSLAMKGWHDWYHVFCYFPFTGGFFRESLMCNKNIQIYHPIKSEFAELLVWRAIRVHNLLYSVFGITFQWKLASYRSHSIHLQRRSIDWFLYHQFLNYNRFFQTIIKYVYKGMYIVQ